MDDEQQPDEIRLTVPADPAFARVARVAAGGLAARLGFSYDEVEEVRLAMAEAWSVTMGSGHRDGRVEVVLRALAPGAIEVELRVPERPASAPPGGIGASERVLGAVADEVDLAPDHSSIRLVLRSDD